jgi:hypothetical protein
MFSKSGIAKSYGGVNGAPRDIDKEAESEIQKIF